MQNQADLPGMHMTPYMLAKFSDPDRGIHISPLRCRPCCLQPIQGFRLLLRQFYEALSLHHSVLALMLSALRLMLTSRLRIQGLDTDCWLGFVGSGVSPDYVICTELAHCIQAASLSHGMTHPACALRAYHSSSFRIHSDPRLQSHPLGCRRLFALSSYVPHPS